MMASSLHRILIVRLSSIGDIVLTTPVIRVLRSHFPDARLDYVVKREYAELVDSTPHLTTVYPYDTRSGLQGLRHLAGELRENRYDLLVDLHNNFRSRLLRVLTRSRRTVVYSKYRWRRTLLIAAKLNCYGEIEQVPERYLKPLRPFGIENDDGGLELFPTEAHRRKVDDLLRQAGLRADDPAIALGAIASFPLKQWPVERFVELGRQLVQTYHARILLFGGPADVERVTRIAGELPNHPIVLCGKLSLLESAAALQRCALYVGNDTGTMHIAAAMQRPVVAIFGPTVEEFGFYPYRVPAQVVCKPLACRPCTATGKGQCKLGTHACMQEIAVAEVMDAIHRPGIST